MSHPPSLSLAAALLGIVAFADCAERREPEPKFVPAARPLERGPRTAPASPPPPLRQAVPEQDQRPISDAQENPVHRDDVGAITRARCERETRCGNVGAGKRFSSESACLSVLGVSDSAVFGTALCRSEIPDRRLRPCVEAINAESCDTLLDSLETLPACRQAAVCGQYGVVSQ